MSRNIRRPKIGGRSLAPIFSALGDETRLTLVRRLSDGEPRSIAQLTGDTRLTRQAVTKHLRVLEEVRLVRSVRSGRENLFELDPAPMRELVDFTELVSARWDRALARLKSMVED